MCPAGQNLCSLTWVTTICVRSMVQPLRQKPVLQAPSLLSTTLRRTSLSSLLRSGMQPRLSCPAQSIATFRAGKCTECLLWGCAYLSCVLQHNSGPVYSSLPVAGLSFCVMTSACMCPTMSTPKSHGTTCAPLPTRSVR